MTGCPDLRGRVAIVTGAGKGLGRAYAIHLATCGASVLVNNRRHDGESDTQTSAQQTVEVIQAAGGKAEPNWVDVRTENSGLAMVEQALARFGRLDIVIANAGVDRPCTFQKQSLAEFRAIFDTSFFGNLHLVHAAWPQLMCQDYGRVVLTTSSAGLYANHGQSAYGAAKAAVIGLMRALALEGRRRNVMVNAIAPYGYSQMTAPYLSGPIAEAFDPARVAPLVGWLCSSDCDASGEVLVSGASVVRRAEVGETAARALDPLDVGTVVHCLRNDTLHAHASANDAFASLVRERDQLAREDAT
jgi:NAD(P)-dependent dehydrogenase (short-subunit alcohol dehydrogenase family)